MSTSNRVILFGKRKELFQIIKDNKNSEIFFLRVKASVPLFVYLLNHSKIKKLLILPSLYKLLSKKIIIGLEKSGVEIKVANSKIGRPKINENKIKRILDFNISDKEKIKKLGISRRSFYYYKKKLKK